MLSQKTDSGTVYYHSTSLIDVIGVIPMIVSILAILIGVSSLIIRRRCWIQASVIWEVALGFFGVSITCWRLYSFNSIYSQPDGPVTPDVSMWLHDFSLSWTSAAVSLFSVFVGLLLIGTAWLFKKRAEQVAAPPMRVDQ